MRERIRRMTTAARVLAVGAAALILLCGCAVSEEAQDRSDQRHLRRHFDIPSEFELVSYDGYPSEVGFGQREGLAVSAVYSLTDEQEEAFVAAALEGGWRLLPVPATERKKMGSFVGDVPLDVERGIYVARTAGNEVLRSSTTRPVAEVAHPKDLILGVLDTGANRLHVRIAAGY